MWLFSYLPNLAARPPQISEALRPDLRICLPVSRDVHRHGLLFIQERGKIQELVVLRGLLLGILILPDECTCGPDGNGGSDITCGKSFTVLEKTFEIGMIAHWGICDDTDPNVALQVYIKYGHRTFKHDLAAFGYGTEITKDIPGVGAVLGGEETFGLLELTVTISARLTGNLDNTKLNIGFDICVEEIEGAIKQCMSEIPLYGDKWWPILIPPSGAGMSFTSACSASRRLEEEQRDEERRLEEERRERDRARPRSASKNMM